MFLVSGFLVSGLSRKERKERKDVERVEMERWVFNAEAQRRRGAERISELGLCPRPQTLANRSILTNH